MPIYSDKKVYSVKVKDNCEKLIEVLHPRILVMIDKENPLVKAMLRNTAAQKLYKIADTLPSGYMLLLHDAYRPIAVQRKMFEKRKKELKKLNPKWNCDKIYAESAKYIAPPEYALHASGGTVDVTLVKDGRELDMGTRLDEMGSVKSHTHSKRISLQAQKNRKMLVLIMKKQGFVNYPREWWHWSYGDRYWAVSRKSFALYDNI